MNKKLLFGIMSLAALAACTNDDFESKNGAQVSEQVSPIQFEVINNAEVMRASMDGNSIAWSAADGDLFTLYHGAAYATPAATTGYQNATYTAKANEGSTATLTTPSMILPGSAIMVWPADTTFRITATDDLTIQIPQVQGGKVNGKEIIQYQIPYVSDVIEIQPYAAYSETTPVTAYNTAGKDRKYQIYMRPMASQLNLKADYGTTESQIAALYEGAAGVDAGEGIDPIEVTSVDLLTLTGTDFTTKIPLQFAAPTVAQGTNWASVANHAWTQVTDFNVAGIVPTDKVDKLTTKCLLEENKGCKFLILPQTPIGVTGVNEGAVVVNTTYGKVVVAPKTFGTNTGKYSATEIGDAWYRITNTAVPAATAALYNETAATAAETSGEFAGKFKTTANVMQGMAQVIDAFSDNTVKTATSKVVGEPTGAAGTRYVKVLLNYLDMTDLHVKNDKQLRDAAKVWKKMGLDDVTVYLDGNAAGEFEISQKTIKVINDINATVAGKDFKVKPCKVAGERCSKIVITGASEEANVQNLDFIRDNATGKADVILKAGESWVWNGTVKVATATGINQFINKGTLTNNADKVLAITDNTIAANQLFTIPLINDGTWNVTAGTLRVQFNVTNNGTVNISKGAQYRQDGQEATAKKTTFTNEATDKPSRFGGDDSKIGKVENKGVFATIGGADINNYGLIEHADKDAKTYITNNEIGAAPVFASPFDATVGSENKMGRINLPFSNKDEDNISISAGLAEGFVSVTVSTTDGAPSGGSLNASSVGEKVNYVIINSGVTTVTEMSNKIQFIEFNDDSKKEIAWQAGTKASPKTATYQGLMIFSPVNIKLYTNVVVTRSTYLAAKVYAGGGFTPVNYSGYFGNTASNEASMVITY